MKTPIYPKFAAALVFLAAGAQGETPASIHPYDISFRHEVQLAIDKGLTWLKTSQNTNGSWSTPDQPALTALALTAFMGEPSGSNQAHPSPAIERGYQFITSNAKPDGSIYAKGLENYNTSLCMMSLIAARNPQFDPLLRRGRQWIISQQVKTNTDWDGGVGYGYGMDCQLSDSWAAAAGGFAGRVEAQGTGNREQGKRLHLEVVLHRVLGCCSGYKTCEKVQAVVVILRDLGRGFHL